MIDKIILKHTLRFCIVWIENIRRDSQTSIRGLAANFCTLSTAFRWCGSQTEAQYSSLGRTAASGG